MVMGTKIETAEQAKQNPAYLAALTELLFQLADDDFILAYRGSEWLGLAPHIEEDVAFSSMSQDMMGHAVMFYEMLEDLGVGKADDLAQLRKPEEFKTALLIERPNGEGHYINNPKYDWAYAVARNYFYSLFKETRLEALYETNYQPLVLAARKIIKEERYHLMHWTVWMRHLTHGTCESRERIDEAIERVWKDLGSLLSYGPNGAALVEQGLIESQEALTQRFQVKLKTALEKLGLTFQGLPGAPELDGRAGQHTDALADAVNTLSEVYKLDPATEW